MLVNEPIPNPYEPPRVLSPTSRPDFSDRSQEMEELLRRIETLEKQVAGSWFVQPNWFKRTAAVWGYLLLAYGVFIPVYAIVVLVVWLLTGQFP